MSYDGLQLGRYQLLHTIDNAEKSSIYLAEDTRTRRQVAIEILQAEAASDADTGKEAAHLLLEEMKAIDMLDHPNILPFFDFGDESIDGTTFTYLVMSFRKEVQKTFTLLSAL